MLPCSKDKARCEEMLIVILIESRDCKHCSGSHIALRTWAKKYVKRALLDLEGALLCLEWALLVLKGTLLQRLLKSGGPWSLWLPCSYIPGSMIKLLKGSVSFSDSNNYTSECDIKFVSKTSLRNKA